MRSLLSSWSCRPHRVQLTTRKLHNQAIGDHDLQTFGSCSIRLVMKETCGPAVAEDFFPKDPHLRLRCSNFSPSCPYGYTDGTMEVGLSSEFGHTSSETASLDQRFRCTTHRKREREREREREGERETRRKKETELLGITGGRPSQLQRLNFGVTASTRVFNQIPVPYARLAEHCCTAKAGPNVLWPLSHRSSIAS